MKLTYTTASKRITAEFEADTHRELFAQIAKFQEVFELRCADCGAKLAFGSMKKGGGLFPKRKDGDTWLPDNGWQKWNPKTKTVE